MAHRFDATIVLAVIFAALGAGFVSPARGAITLQVGTVEAAPGERVSIPVVLHTDGEPVSVLQNDLLLNAPIWPAGGDQPVCAQGPDVPAADVGTRFSYLDPISGSTIRAQSGAVLSLLPSDVILYTCSVEVDADAALGSYAIGCTEFVSGDAEGNELGGVCAAGSVEVVDRPLPTPSDTPATVEPTPLPTPPPGTTPALEVGTASGAPGDRVQIEFRLHIGSDEVSGIQADIAYDPVAPFARGTLSSRRPDCVFGTDPSVAGFSSTSFQPPGCTDDCTAIRIIILKTDAGPLPDDALLITCAVDIAADATPRTYPLSLSNLGASTPEGQWVELGGLEGSVTVTGPGGESQLPATGGSGGAASGGGGCAVVGQASNTGVWSVLAGLVALVLVARRARS